MLFLIDMEHRKFHISTTGNMIDILNDRRIQSIINNVTPDMKNGEYYQAIKTVLDDSESYIKQGVAPNSFRKESDKSTGLSPLIIVVAILTGCVTCLLFYLSVSRKYLLKKSSYHYPYYELSSLDLTESQTVKTFDITTSRHIPKPPSNNGSSTHMGSSGTNHGGGSGSF